jgi:hypothetical protein
MTKNMEYPETVNVDTAQPLITGLFLHHLYAAYNRVVELKNIKNFAAGFYDRFRFLKFNRGGNEKVIAAMTEESTSDKNSIKIFNATTQLFSDMSVGEDLISLILKYANEINIKYFKKPNVTLDEITTYRSKGWRYDFAELVFQMTVDDPTLNSEKTGVLITPVQYEAAKKDYKTMDDRIFKVLPTFVAEVYSKCIVTLDQERLKLTAGLVKKEIAPSSTPTSASSAVQQAVKQISALVTPATMSSIQAAIEKLKNIKIAIKVK